MLWFHFKLPLEASIKLDQANAVLRTMAGLMLIKWPNCAKAVIHSSIMAVMASRMRTVLPFTAKSCL